MAAYIYLPLARADAAARRQTRVSSSRINYFLLAARSGLRR
jgi:hypothetical protein